MARVLLQDSFCGVYVYVWRYTQLCAHIEEARVRSSIFSIIFCLLLLMQSLSPNLQLQVLFVPAFVFVCFFYLLCWLQQSPVIFLSLMLTVLGLWTCGKDGWHVMWLLVSELKTSSTFNHKANLQGWVLKYCILHVLQQFLVNISMQNSPAINQPFVVCVFKVA